MSCTHFESLPSSVPAGTIVYKDDCMYSFDTPENSSVGLDVCLSCFKAYSRASTNYTIEHTQLTSHSVYLNIIKRLKPETERPDGPQSKIAKLEIKESKEEDLYDITYSIYCASDNSTIAVEEAPQSVQELVRSVIAANSSHRQEEIKAWEQEIVPCQHSLLIEQITNSVDLTKCLQCELDQNLWICLHCGALGCGRLQYGSNIPGNSHALKHFEESTHPVAVKLGSLSATDMDNYDAYCYQCNDEVKIPGLVQKLQTYGIDLDKTVKTEKNLTEINLDQNLNWEFQLDGKDGNKLQPLYGENLTGLSNLGNSCYLNSVVQALFHLQPYIEFFKKKTFPSYEKVPDPSQDLLSQLLKLYDGLLSGRYSKPGNSKGEGYQLGIKPTLFKSLVGKDHPEFRTNRQQDAFEFMVYLLDKIDKEFGYEVNKPLKFLLTNKVLCSGCFQGKASDELVDNIAVDIDDEVESTSESGKQYKPFELLEGFKHYCEDEVIDGFKCDKCNETTSAIKSAGFKSFPDILVVNAKRIKLENWVPIKVDVPIPLPEELDLLRFKAEISDNFEVVKEDEGSGFTPNQDVLNNLLQMGFPEPRCIKALYTTGNSNLDDAMNWIFAHMEDPDIDAPLVIEESQESTGPSDELIGNLTVMGFLSQLAKKALVLNNNDPNAAVEWLFSNPDDDGVIPELPTKVDLAKEKKSLVNDLSTSSNSGKYKLKSVVCHKGVSPHTGHYVVFIKQDDKWVLFNDEKVVEVDEESIKDLEKNSYIYVFESV